MENMLKVLKVLFLSTPSARRATAAVPSLIGAAAFLSTPSARRATDLHRFIADFGVISIHALCEEGDPKKLFCINGFVKFLSTPSARRATSRGQQARGISHISIHALCEEGDSPVF